MRAHSLYLAVAVFGGMVVQAFAAEMTIENGRDIVIDRLVVAAAGSDRRLNVLGTGETLDPGYLTTIEFDPTQQGCIFDFEAGFIDGSARSVNGYDACRADPSDDAQWVRFED